MTLITAPYTHDGVPVLELLQQMAGAAMDALAQTPMGVPPEGGLWHDAPTEDCCHGLYLWVQEWTPVAAGQFPQTAVNVDRCLLVDLIPRIAVTVRRPCAPIPDEAGNVPYADELAAAEDLIVDARALLCGITATWPTLVDAKYPGGRIMWGSITPTGAASNCFGWDFTATIEITGCRAACSP